MPIPQSLILVLLLSEPHGSVRVSQLREAAKDLLERTQPPDRAQTLADLLTSGKWTHDYPITYDKAQHDH